MKQRIAAALCAGFLWTILQSAYTVEAQSRGPEQTVRDYYDAIGRQDCAAAAVIRPGYSEEKCFDVDRIVKFEEPIVLKPVGNYRVVHLGVTIRRKTKKNRDVTFDGFVTLKLAGGRWVIITHSFRSRTSIDDYLEWAKAKGVILDPEDQRILANNAELSSRSPDPDDIRDLVEQDNPPIQTAEADREEPGSESLELRPKKQPSPRSSKQNTTRKKPALGRPYPDGPSHGNMWRGDTLRTFGSRKIMQACWPGGRDLRAKRGEQKTRKTGPGARLSRPKRLLPHRNLAGLPKKLRRSIRRVDVGGRKVVALTFDTGERNNDFAGYDGKIIDYLRDHRVKATFYFGGKWMATHPKRSMQLIADPLFEMGNHAWTHGNMRVLKGRAMESQILYTQAQYELILEQLWNHDCMRGIPDRELFKVPQQIPTFRYPYGTCSNESLNAVNRFGLPAVQWDVVTADPWRGQTAKGIARTVLSKTKPGSIVIMHSNGRGWKTAKALPLFIPKLMARGYKFVTVTELLLMGKPIATNTCYELKPGDNKRYDKIFGRGTGD